MKLESRWEGAFQSIPNESISENPNYSLQKIQVLKT